MSETNSKRVIKQGLLMKRCRWSWRPRFIEIITDPPDFSGPLYSFLLLIYDQAHRTIKKRIRVEDIVTIRAGKNCSFQIYLNSGMFILFRAESMECQSSWMAELKMALGRGNVFHVQVSTPTDNFVLDHALLYCIGVNLPNHHYGQVDRVLVVASPINDVNLHAWNLSRVKRFMIVEAGIQMELCGNCMGHRKKTVTFVMSPENIPGCTEFLVKEARLPSEPKKMSLDGPIYYSLPHSCSLVVEGTEAPFPMYTNAEMIVLGRDAIKKSSTTSTGIYINYDVGVRTRSQSSASSISFSSFNPPPKSTSAKSMSLQPSLPPRGVFRGSHDDSETPSEQPRHFNHAPYHIDHRIYVNKSGVIKEDSHVLGSWDHTGNIKKPTKAPVIPPRFGTSRFLPVYVEEEDIHTPTATQSPAFKRPEFIGSNPPCLPPRNTDGGSSSPLTKIRHSTSDSNLLTEECYSPQLTRRNSEYPSGRPFHDSESSASPPPPPPPSSPPNYEHVLYQNVPSGHNTPPRLVDSQKEPKYVNNNRSPSPQMCTDDITNAEFALITKVTFSGQVLPPRNQTRTLRPPVPAPRTNGVGNNHKKQNDSTTAGTSTTTNIDTSTGTTITNIDTTNVFNTGTGTTTSYSSTSTTTTSTSSSAVQCTSTLETELSASVENDSARYQTDCEEAVRTSEEFAYNPMYSSVFLYKERSSSSVSSQQSSPLLQKKRMSHLKRFNSLSSSSLASDDYKKVSLSKQYSHEV